MLGIFTPVKIQRLRLGLNPQTWVPEASTLIIRPPKPSKKLQSALNQCNVQTESEDNRCCVNTIFPPEDGHLNARNMSRIIV